MDLLLVPGAASNRPSVPAGEATRKSTAKTCEGRQLAVPQARGAAPGRPSRYVLARPSSLGIQIPLVGHGGSRPVTVVRITGSGVIPGRQHSVGARVPGGAPRPDDASTRKGRVEVVQGGIRGVGAGDIERPVVRSTPRADASGVPVKRTVAVPPVLVAGLLHSVDSCQPAPARRSCSWLLPAPLKIIVQASVRRRDRGRPEPARPCPPATGRRCPLAGSRRRPGRTAHTPGRWSCPSAPRRDRSGSPPG